MDRKPICILTFGSHLPSRPGTGKTSLCRALAQKLAIRLTKRYAQCRILEVNSHSLFSRWFSESGKLVQKLFAGITEMVDEEDTFVVVLIGP
jgi:SpoVK/Ycf46/Vps4 family AAA+-type ATPase